MDAIAIALRFALYLDLMALFGVAAFGLYGLRGGERLSGAAIAFRPLLGGTALLGLLLSAAGLAALAAAMAGVPLRAVDSASIAMVITETTVGTAWIARVAALALVLVAVLTCGRWPVLMLSSAGLGGGMALASLAWGGHAAMREGAVGTVHLGADILHLLAAGIWIGALAALLLLVFRRSEQVTTDHLWLSHRALAGFATIGTVVVATLIVTGTANLLLVVHFDQLSALPGSLYGQLLLFKLGVRRDARPCRIAPLPARTGVRAGARGRRSPGGASGAADKPDGRNPLRGADPRTGGVARHARSVADLRPSLSGFCLTLTSCQTLSDAALEETTHES